MSGLVIRPVDWPVPIAALVSGTLIFLSAAGSLDIARVSDGSPEPAPEPVPAPEAPEHAYAPAPGRDDRTPVEFMDQVFGLNDPSLAAKLSGIGPVFWHASGRGSGALIDRDLVLTTAHLFVKGGTWYGGNGLLPLPPDPAKGSIYLEACGRSYGFNLIEVGDETPRGQLGLDYAIARLTEPACEAAAVLTPTALSPDEIEDLINSGPVLLNMGAYDARDLPRWAEHPLMTSKADRADGLERLHIFGVACALVAIDDTGEHPRGSTGVYETEGCDGVPGGSGGPLLISRDGGESYEIIGVANSFRPDSEYNNYTRIEGAFAHHLARFLPNDGLNIPDASALSVPIASPLDPGPWLAMEDDFKRPIASLLEDGFERPIASLLEDEFERPIASLNEGGS